MSNIIPYSQKNIEKIVSVLEQGGVVVFPTETVYALACRADDSSTAEKIYNIKCRTSDKVFAVLAPSVEFIEEHADIAAKSQKLISKLSPGPVTYILPIKENSNFSDYAVRHGKTGFRIPDHPVALEILRGCNFPVIATSVNKSGQKSAGSVSEIDADILSETDLVMNGEPSSGVSSTVVSFEEGDIIMLRHGAVDFADIQKIWDEG